MTWNRRKRPRGFFFRRLHFGIDKQIVAQSCSVIFKRAALDEVLSFMHFACCNCNKDLVAIAFFSCWLMAKKAWFATCVVLSNGTSTKSRFFCIRTCTYFSMYLSLKKTGHFIVNLDMSWTCLTNYQELGRMILRYLNSSDFATFFHSWEN